MDLKIDLRVTDPHSSSYAKNFLEKLKNLGEIFDWGVQDEILKEHIDDDAYHWELLVSVLISQDCIHYSGNIETLKNFVLQYDAGILGSKTVVS